MEGLCKTCGFPKDTSLSLNGRKPTVKCMDSFHVMGIHVIDLLDALGEAMSHPDRDDKDCEMIYGLYNYLGKKYI